MDPTYFCLHSLFLSLLSFLFGVQPILTIKDKYLTVEMVWDNPWVYMYYILLLLSGSHIRMSWIPVHRAHPYVKWECEMREMYYNGSRIWPDQNGFNWPLIGLNYNMWKTLQEKGKHLVQLGSYNKAHPWACKDHSRLIKAWLIRDHACKPWQDWLLTPIE